MENGIKVQFVGQAGFIFENDNNYRIGVDLYLSDCCYRYFGFKRLMPFILDPIKLDLDLLLCTHAHYDHFDPDSIPLIMTNRKTKLICAYDCCKEVKRLGIEDNRVTYIKAEDELKKENIIIKALPCDHGAETPDAVGLLLEIGGKKIYIAGDTSFRSDFFERSEVKNVDLFIMPINGAFGNMNESEGATASKIIQPKLTVPCHYWNFAEHGGNPDFFAKEIKKAAPFNQYMLMRVGETIVL